jgi:hypothetical protein
MSPTEGAGEVATDNQERAERLFANPSVRD